MSQNQRPGCPDCDASAIEQTHAVQTHAVHRRDFLVKATTVAGLTAASGVALPRLLVADDKKPAAAKPESVVKQLYDSLSEKQRGEICFAWDHQDKERGLLRTRVGANWHITRPAINSEFFTKDQQAMIRQAFEGIIQPDWHKKFDKQLKDDAGGFGNHQNIAIFGQPGDGKFQMVMTGRHMTLRCDGDSADHVVFGGPIFYGHAATGGDEDPGHPGNVFWEQAIAANEVFQMLDGKQRKKALLDFSPSEEDVGFQGKEGKFPGLSVADMSGDQRELVQKTLQKLIEPYRQSDRDEALAALKSLGGLEKCSLAFYKDSDYDNDQVWDNWRLEGPAFVWFFRGNPHVHVWVNVASSPEVKLNA